jgi:hypothetical protein
MEYQNTFLFTANVSVNFYLFIIQNKKSFIFQINYRNLQCELLLPVRAYLTSEKVFFGGISLLKPS